MRDLTFDEMAKYEIPEDEEFAYGIESIEIKKHVCTPGRDVQRGAILRNPNTGKKFFVTEADLARYRCSGTAAGDPRLGQGVRSHPISDKAASRPRDPSR